MFRLLPGLAVVTLFALPGTALAFGSLAIQSNHGGRVGWAHNFPTQDEADEEAQRDCGPSCTVVLQFHNTCAAYATDQNGGSTVFGWSIGATRAKAESSALDQCESSGGGNCETKVWACE
jgi:Domain of unknown function (DUF4189)